MKHHLYSLLCLLPALLAGSRTFSQGDTAVWALTANQSAVTTGTITATSQAFAGLTVNNYLSGSGGQRVKTLSGDWPAETGPNSGRYLQYTVTPGSADNLLITSVSLGLSFNSSAVVHASLAWSTDGVAYTNIAGDISIVSGAIPAVSEYGGLNILVQSGQTFYLRVSPWSTGAQAPTKFLVSKNVTIAGVSAPADSAVWPLTSAQGANTGSDMVASAQALAGLTVNDYISSQGGQRLKTVTGDWPAESGANSSRYVQYTVAPAAGKDMTITQVSVPMSFNSSSFVHARIAWSINGTEFTDLIADTNLETGSLPAAITIGGLHAFVADGQTFYLRVYPWSTVVQAPVKFFVSKNVEITGITQPAPQLAFPRAEGGGRFAKGGRGGSIYYVTTLADSGPGSLRDAVSKGNRTILFKVSGTIHLAKELSIGNDYLTIAGQTAPGDGICVANYNVIIRASHIILRYLRFRLGDVDSVVTDALDAGIPVPGPASVRDVIIDHCSMSWSVDETGSFYAVGDFTLQWCILSESFFHSFHPNDTTSTDTVNHGYGGIWGGQNASFHHNLLASHTSRNPRFSGSANTQRPDLEYVDYRNNVVYNWGYINSAYAGNGGHQNMVNNYYKPGPATPGGSTSSRTNKRNRILQYNSFVVSAVNGDTIWGGQFYIDGNHTEGYPDVTADNWTNGVQPDSYPGADSMIALARQTSPFPYAPVVTQTAEAAYVSVTDSAGAILPRRDTIDRRIIRETKTGTATFEGAGYSSISNAGITHPSGIIDSQHDVEGWPVLTGTTYPNDTDNDGLPDWWEAKTTGTDADTTSIIANDYGTDGYTMLEKYLDAIQSPDQQVLFVTDSGRRTASDSVRIAWTIDWAKDQFTFGLFRSADNINFTLLDTVPSNINKTRYVLYDAAVPPGQGYYKVGSYRTAGASDTIFSPTIRIDSSAEMMNSRATADTTSTLTPAVPAIEDIEFRVHPNPASGLLFVEHSAARPGAFLSLYASGGQLLGTYKPAAGSTQTTINIASFSRGAYLLVMDNAGSSKTLVFIKQ
ncbi:MAG TPA: T9SS type A sorting domain-containing protein [Puia sp.]|jgi:hypothetical protein